MNTEITFRIPVMPDKAELIAEGRKHMAEKPEHGETFVLLFGLIMEGHLTYLVDSISGLSIWLKILPDGRLMRECRSEADVQWTLNAIQGWGGTDIHKRTRVMGETKGVQ